MNGYEQIPRKTDTHIAWSKFSKWAEMSEQPFATKLGMSASPPDFVECSRLIAFQTSPTKAEVK
jgi:hypothetical protein